MLHGDLETQKVLVQGRIDWIKYDSALSHLESVGRCWVRWLESKLCAFCPYNCSMAIQAPAVMVAISLLKPALVFSNGCRMGRNSTFQGHTGFYPSIYSQHELTWFWYWDDWRDGIGFSWWLLCVSDITHRNLGNRHHFCCFIPPTG